MDIEGYEWVVSGMAVLAGILILAFCWPQSKEKTYGLESEDDREY